MPTGQSPPNRPSGPQRTPLRLKNRADFVAAAQQGLRWSAPGFLMQAHPRPDRATPRIGFTVTKKIGNAVIRNRLKRRLREVVRLAAPTLPETGIDFVLIGREPGLVRSFAEMQLDFAAAVDGIARKLKRAEARLSPPSQPEAGTRS